MADNDEVSGTPDPDATPTEETRRVLPPESASPPAGSTPAPVMKPRWRDRAWTFRAMLAVALATLLLGGVVGGTIVALADDDRDDPGHFRIGPGDRVPPGWRGPREFHDGGPDWRWDDGPPPPDGGVAPDGTPSPTPSPSPSQ